MKTGFEEKSNEQILQYLLTINANSPFNQMDWNLLCLEIFRRLCKQWEKK